MLVDPLEEMRIWVTLEMMSFRKTFPKPLNKNVSIEFFASFHLVELFKLFFSIQASAMFPFTILKV